jgi:DNA-directed RNA polymerase subunit RPC12/RpoP
LKIAFACPNCAKPLVADSALAGRTGRCRHCGQRTVVPNGQPAPGALAQSGLGNPPVAAGWQTAVASQLPTGPAGSSAATSRAAAKPTADTPAGYSLRPVTPVNTPALAASDWDNAELGPAVAAPPSVFTSPANVAPKQSRGVPAQSRGAAAQSRGAAPTAAAGPTSANIFTQLTAMLGPLANVITPGATQTVSSGGASGATSILVAYRLFFGLLGRVTTWISETSYTVSFILIILAVASGMIGRHSLATMLCGAVVALNLVGLAGDITSLVTLSFRKSPLQGGLFLVPPFTLYYLWTDWYRYRDTVLRMRIPLVTLALVVAAYAYVPWLRGGIKAEVPAVETVEKAVDSVEAELAGQKGVLDEGLKKARSWLREVPLPDSSSLPGSHGTNKPAPGRKP